MFTFCVTEDSYDLFQHRMVAPATLPSVSDPRRSQPYGTHADIQPLQPASVTGNLTHVRLDIHSRCEQNALRSGL
jgi:hypothetical protein